MYSLPSGARAYLVRASFMYLVAAMLGERDHENEQLPPVVALLVPCSRSVSRRKKHKKEV